MGILICERASRPESTTTNLVVGHRHPQYQACSTRPRHPHIGGPYISNPCYGGKWGPKRKEKKRTVKDKGLWDEHDHDVQRHRQASRIRAPGSLNSTLSTTPRTSALPISALLCSICSEQCCIRTGQRAGERSEELIRATLGSTRGRCERWASAQVWRRGEVGGCVRVREWAGLDKTGRDRTG